MPILKGAVTIVPNAEFRLKPGSLRLVQTVIRWRMKAGHTLRAVKRVLRWEWDKLGVV